MRFPELFAGSVDLISDRGFTLAAEVVAGETREVEFKLPVGTDVTGMVVDPAGNPVGGAEIWGEGRRATWPCGHLLGTSRADGRFRLRGLAPGARFGARAAGFQPSVLHEHDELSLATDGSRTVTLGLGAPGGSVAGRVLDPDGRPVGGARIQIGKRGGFIVNLPSGLRGTAAVPVPVMSNVDGEFVYAGDLPSGEQPVAAMVRGHPIWSGSVEIKPGERTWLEIQLAKPARVQGRVVSSEGIPMEGARVVASRETGGGWYFDAYPPSAALTDAAGLFLLDWVAPGVQELNASLAAQPRLGKARANVACKAGETVEVELVLDLGLTIRGRVVDGAGRALVGWGVYGKPLDYGAVYPRGDKTDAEGGFLLANLGDCAWRVQVSAPGEVPVPPRAENPKVLPGTEALEFVVTNLPAPPATLRGLLLDGRGGIPQDVKLTIYRENSDSGLFVEVDGATGRFEHQVKLPGRYSLRVIRGGKTLKESEPIDLASGETNDIGILQIGEPGRCELTLRGIPEARLAQLGARLDRAQSGTEELTLEGGRFRSGPLAAGNWILRVSGGPWFVRDQEVEIVAGETLRLEAEAVQGFKPRLAFAFENADASWTRLQAEVRDEQGSLVRIGGPWRSDTFFEGSPSFAGLILPQGSFTVTAWTDTGLRGSHTLKIPQDLSPAELVIR